VIPCIPRRIAERLEREAKRLGLSLEEYIFELVLRNLDPSEIAQEYIEVTKSFLKQAREELQKGDIRQAAGKVWSTTALAVKAYAAWRDRKRLVSHGELWEYKRIMVKEFGR